MNSYERVKQDAREKHPQWSDRVIELTAGLVPMLATSLLEEMKKKKEENQPENLHVNDIKTAELTYIFKDGFENLREALLYKNS
jgi:hypothetical protein